MKGIFKDFKELKDNIKISKTPSHKKGPTSNKDLEIKKNKVEQDEELLFKQAMSGVKPLNKTKGGREVLLSKHEIKKNKGHYNTSSDKKYLEKFVRGEIKFEIEFTDEYIQGNVLGLDPKIFKKLKTGSYSPEAHLDLHGLNSGDAYLTLLEFVKRNYLAGKRCLLVIPGRGKNSPFGRGILRENLRQWITRDPLKRVVLAFSTAIPRHGGAGAIYVLLRKYKKSRGKILWERY